MKKLTILFFALALTLVGCAPKEQGPMLPEEGKSPALERMETLTAGDIKYMTSNFHNVDEIELAHVLNAAAANVTEEVDETTQTQNFYWLEVYLSGGPDTFSSNDERFYLEAGLDDALVHVDYHDGDGGRESFFVSDVALRKLLRENFRTGSVIDMAAYNRYGTILEQRAQERVDNSQGTSASAYNGYEITEFVSVERYEEDGYTYKVYQWSVGFVPDDPYTVGWAGGMFLDADGRVCALEQDTYFVVRISPDGTEEHRFLFWDLYFGTDEEAGRANAHEMIRKAFET